MGLNEIHEYTVLENGLDTYMRITAPWDFGAPSIEDEHLERRQ